MYNAEPGSIKPILKVFKKELWILSLVTVMHMADLAMHMNVRILQVAPNQKIQKLNPLLV